MWNISEYRTLYERYLENSSIIILCCEDSLDRVTCTGSNHAISYRCRLHPDQVVGVRRETKTYCISLYLRSIIPMIGRAKESNKRFSVPEYNVGLV